MALTENEKDMIRLYITQMSPSVQQLKDMAALTDEEIRLKMSTWASTAKENPRTMMGVYNQILSLEE